jgi:hypothetical protein
VVGYIAKGTVTTIESGSKPEIPAEVPAALGK